MNKARQSGEQAMPNTQFGLVETTRNTLLLDECVTRRVVIRNEDVKVIHSVGQVGIGADDKEILKYAQKTGVTIVTRDFRLFCQSLDSAVDAAIYYKGKIFVLKTDDIIPIGEDIPVTMPAIRYFRPLLPRPFENPKNYAGHVNVSKWAKVKKLCVGLRRLYSNKLYRRL
jgi:hypothetical protein